VDGIDGSDTGGGVSDGPGAYPTIRVGPGDVYNVAWMESVDLVNQIYFLRIQPPPPPSLSQHRLDGLTPVPVGGTVPETGIVCGVNPTPGPGPAVPPAGGLRAGGHRARRSPEAEGPIVTPGSPTWVKL